jgi:hypothetical protein
MPSESDQLPWQHYMPYIYVAVFAAAASFIFAHEGLLPQPYHTSPLTGQLWLDELLGRGSNAPNYNPKRVREILGVHRHVFLRLVHILRSQSDLKESDRINAEERVAIFLYIARMGSSNHQAAECFQRGGETISKWVTLHITSFPEN